MNANPADRAAGLPADATTAAAQVIAGWSIKLPYPDHAAAEVLAAAGPVIAAEAARQERQRIRPLLLALHHLYDVVWNQVGTVDLSDRVPGYNGISYDDDNAIEEAAKPVEALLASGEFADLLEDAL